MKSNKLVIILLSVLLLSSIFLPVVQVAQAQVNWVSPIDIAVTGKGLVFGKGQHKITVSATVDRNHGGDIRHEKWNPASSANSKSGQSRTENMRGSGFEMDFYVEKDVSEIKFDLYATQDVSVALTVSGEDKGNYVFRQGRLTINLFDVFTLADNFSYDTDTQTIYFTMAAGERIDPLISYNEIAGTYVYDALADYAPGVVLPAAYAANQTIHPITNYDANTSTYQDWQIATAGKYTVIDADSASFEWILENLREETNPGLTDGETSANGRERVLVDEKGDAFWASGGDAGAGAFVFAVQNSTNAVRGSVALNATIVAGGNEEPGIIGTFAPAIDITASDWIGFWINCNTTESFELFLAGGQTKYVFTHPGGGYRRYVFSLRNDPTYATAQTADLTAVNQMFIRHTTPQLGDEIFFDRFVTDSTIWGPSEFYIGDNTTSIDVYNLDSTGADPKILFHWDVNGTTDGSIYPGNLRNLEDEWLGSIAKQNATDWTLKANTTLPAGSLGEFLINMTTQLPSGGTRIAIPADFTTDQLRWWNQRNSILYGSPWAGPEASPSANSFGDLGQTQINSGANLKIFRIDYSASGNIAPVVGNSRFNWNLTQGANTYSYEYWIDNDDVAAQNATIEVNIPNLPFIATYTLSYWNGAAYVPFMDFASGNITQPKSINQTSLDAAMYLEGLRTEAKVIVNATAGLADIGPITYGNDYGVINKFGFTVELLKDDAVPQDGADEIRLMFTMTYVNDGEATYEFNRDGNQFWGLDNVDQSAIEIFDGTSGSETPYLILLMAQKPDALWVTANAAQRITAVEFNATGTYKVLTDTALGTETTTAPTGETIQLTADRWQYYKNIAQFDRGERTDNDVGEGDAGFGWTYSSLPGSDQKVAIKVPLAPWQNATIVDVDSGRSQMRFRAVVNYGDPSTWSYTADLSSNTEAQYMLTLLCDFYRDSYNIGPTMPMKNNTITFTDPRTSTPYSFEYVATPGQTAAERSDVENLAINGAVVQSKVVPVGTIAAGAGPTQNITVNLGIPTNPVVDRLSGGNLTAVSFVFDTATYTATMVSSVSGTLVIDTGGYGAPRRINGETSSSYNATSDEVTLTLGSGTRIVRLFWQTSLTDPIDQSINIMITLFPLIAIVFGVLIMQLGKMNYISNRLVIYALVVAVAAIILGMYRALGV